MKVKELIEKLQKLNPEIDCLVHGYKDGYNDVHYLNEINIERNVNTAWYLGKHDKSKNNGVSSVVISAYEESDDE